MIRDFCVIVPAYNEEKVISSSLRSLKNVFDPCDIYVVSDGSTDNTASLASLEGVNVLNLKKNRGKALAQEKVIKCKKLTKRYKYVLFSDADSQIDANFLIAAKVHLSKNPALIVGTVKAHRKGFISAFRTFEYGLSHRVYKTAQNFIKTITVAPGCASLYNSQVLEKLNLKSETLTEDFDLTIQIHKGELGDIIYASNAIVTTQDPINLKDYWKQVLRWNIGTWQNYFLHKLYKMNKKFNLELNFLFLDNVMWIVSLVFGILFPAVLLHIVAGVTITIYSFALIIALLEKKLWVVPYIPVFPLFFVINIISYFYALFRVIYITKKKKTFSWNKVSRFEVN